MFKVQSSKFKVSFALTQEMSVYTTWYMDNHDNTMTVQLSYMQHPESLRSSAMHTTEATHPAMTKEGDLCMCSRPVMCVHLVTSDLSPPTVEPWQQHIPKKLPISSWQPKRVSDMTWMILAGTQTTFPSNHDLLITARHYFNRHGEYGDPRLLPVRNEKELAPTHWCQSLQTSTGIRHIATDQHIITPKFGEP